MSNIIIDMESLSITLLIIVLTAITSFMAFNNRVIRGAALFYPHAIHARGEWYRFITSGFIHADFLHLAVNMYVLYSFGTVLEKYYLPAFFGTYANLMYVGLYILGMIVADVPTYIKQRHNATYLGLGASGAVAAILFACILFGPFTGEIGLLFIPGVGIPPIVFGIIYLAYSAYMSRMANDHINHDAHFYGAIFGFIFPGLFKPDLFISLWTSIQQTL